MSQIITKIAKNTFFSFISKTVGFLAALILSIITARFLGPDKFGSYSLVITTLLVAGLLTNLGLSSVGTKYIAEFSGPSKEKIRSAIFHYILKIKVCITLIVIAILILLAPLYANFYSDNNLKSYIIILAFGLLPNGLALIFSSVISGLQEYKYMAHRAMFLAPINVLLTAIVLIAGFGVFGLILVNVLISFIEFLFYVNILKNRIGFKFENAVLPLDIKKKIFRYNWQVALIVFIDAIIWQRSEVFFLAKFHSSAQVGFYSLAYGIIEKALVFLPSIFSGILLPAVSELYGNKNTVGLHKLYLNSIRYLSLIAIPVCVGMFVLSKPLILLLYGENYLPVAPVLNILLIAGCFGIIASAPSSICYGTEKQSIILKWGLLIAVFNIILDLLLIPKYSAVGAAIANTFAQISGVFIGFTVVNRTLSIVFPFKDMFKIIFASICIIPVEIAILTINSGFIGISLSVILGGFTYFTALIITKTFKQIDIKLINIVRDKSPKIFNVPLIKLIDLITV